MRLPGKALLPLCGVPMITYLLRRIIHSRLADTIVFATTDLPQDDELTRVVLGEGVPVFRGSSNDVVLRYVLAASRYELDYVVRVTGDCPFVDARTLDYCISLCKSLERFDLATTKRQFPVGIDYEIYDASLMRNLHNANSLTREEREHLTLHIYNMESDFIVHRLSPNPMWLCNDTAFTVDTKDDYFFVSSLAARLPSVSADLETIIETSRRMIHP